MALTWPLEAFKSRKKAPGPTFQLDCCDPVGVEVSGARDHPSLPPPSTGHPYQYSLSPWRCLPSHLQSGQAASLSNIPTPLPDFHATPLPNLAIGLGPLPSSWQAPKSPLQPTNFPEKFLPPLWFPATGYQQQDIQKESSIFPKLVGWGLRAS